MLKEMDLPNTSLKQGRLPFKILDAKSDLQRKRKLTDTDDSHTSAKSMKCVDTIPLDDCADLPNSCGEEPEIENIPSITSSPKTTERNKRVSQNCLNESKLSPVRQKSIRTKEIQKPVEENLGAAAREIQTTECLQKKEASADITLDANVSTNSQCIDQYGSSSDHSGQLATPGINVLDKNSDLNSSVVTNSSSETSFHSGGELSSFDDSTNAEIEKRKQESHSKKKPRMIAKRKKLTEEKMLAKARKKTEKEIERERLQKLKQELKESKERARLEAKAKKDKEKQEKKEREEKEKEEKLRHKIEKKEREERERLEKRQQKQLILDSKLEEKKKKDEEKQRKLDEKRKAEEEEERKNEKAKAAFVSFFFKAAPASLQQVEQQQGLFRPFEVTKDMKLAPCVPSVAAAKFNKDRFEKSFSIQDEQLLYLEELKNNTYKPYLYSKMKAQNEDIDDDVIILDDDIEDKTEKEKLCPKLLQFCENIRPPYWGTWRKKSKVVCGRHPLQKDEIHFDYNVDSDEEWDEGGPGESLSGTEDEKESDDDYEVDNEFFVPHGYLSNDEEDEDENSAVTPETKNALLKMREREFNDERSKKCLELKPKVAGCFQENGMIAFTEELRKSLEVYSIVALTTIPIITTNMLPKVSDNVQSDSASTLAGIKEKSLKTKNHKKSFPEEAMPHFIKLVHANTLGHQKVIREFCEFWQLYCKQTLVKHSDVVSEPEDPQRITSLSRLHGSDQSTAESQPSSCTLSSGVKISKRQLKIALHEIAKWCRGKISANKYCWWVHEEVRQRYNLIDLPIPNSWHYVSMKKEIEKSPKLQVSTLNNTPSIKKFTKIISLGV